MRDDYEATLAALMDPQAIHDSAKTGLVIARCFLVFGIVLTLAGIVGALLFSPVVLILTLIGAIWTWVGRHNLRHTKRLLRRLADARRASTPVESR